MRPARYLVALTAGLLLSAEGQAQFAPQPPPAPGAITSVPATPARLPTTHSAFQPVYPTYVPPPYGGVYVTDPVGGAFNGLANLTTAYGQYGIDKQQSRLMNQDVERSKLDTKRALIEQQLWEQSLQPTPEDLRRRNLETDRRRAAGDPPLSEILSGESLNTLLKNIQDMQSMGAYGPNVPLTDDLLRHINVSATLGSNIAILKDGGKLKWPFVLRDTPFDADRTAIQDYMAKAMLEASSDELTPTTVRGLRGSLTTLESKLDKMAPDMSLTDSMQARRYLDELKSASRALEQPSASSYLTKKVAPQGRSVGELVAYMTQNGLRFTPSLQSEEGYYRSLHQSMVTYNYGTMQTARR